MLGLDKAACEVDALPLASDVTEAFVAAGNVAPNNTFACSLQCASGKNAAPNDMVRCNSQNLPRMSPLMKRLLGHLYHAELPMAFLKQAIRLLPWVASERKVKRKW